MSGPSPKQLIEYLRLEPQPQEGGYFRETYRSTDLWPAAALPARYGHDKAAATAIYFLLTPDTFSALHRLPTDEIYHFYLGSPVRMLLLGPEGEGRSLVLGPDLLAGQHLQMVVPRGTWQGSCLVEGGTFALLGTTVSPAFDRDDFEAGQCATLISLFPQFSELIQKLCPP